MGGVGSAGLLNYLQFYLFIFLLEAAWDVSPSPHQDGTFHRVGASLEMTVTNGWGYRLAHLTAASRGPFWKACDISMI